MQLTLLQTTIQQSQGMTGDQLFVFVFTILGMVFSVMYPLTLYLLWKRILPPVLRTLFWATRRRQPLLLLCHDSGRSILTTIAERQGEGIVLTAQNKYKILPRFSPKLPLNEIIARATQRVLDERAALQEEAESDPANGEQPEAKETEDAKAPEVIEPPSEGITGYIPELDLNSPFFNVKLLNESFILDYGDYTNKRSFLMGIDVPIFVGYTGKLCLLNPEALALYEAGDMMVNTGDLAMFNPKNVPDKDVKKAMQPLLLLNARKIQEIIYKGFDQSQIAGVVADSEELVRQQMQGMGGMFSGKIKYIIIFAIMAAAGIAGVLFLPQLLKNFSGSQTQQQIFLDVITKVLGR